MKWEKFLKLNSSVQLFKTLLKISQFVEHVLIIHFFKKIIPEYKIVH